VRNLTKTIAAVSLLMPVSAYPLGIGDIKLHSALNQKLDAEIALLVSKDENASDITVRLASPDKFLEAGVPWSYFLSDIKFKAVTQADGSTVVKLSSKEALKEPFLDFLIEVTWAKGNLYREFTVLVDPPVRYEKATHPVIEKPQQSVTEYVDSRPVNTARRIVTSVDGEYGPTIRTDSIWKIAEKTNVYDDVSIEQMMMSIYETNPRAFFKKNVNALMAGKTLKIPEKDVILKLSKKQALAAFKEQDDIWRGRVTKKSVRAEQNNSQLTTQLELEAPVADEVTEAVDVATGEDATTKPVNVSEISDTKLATSDEGLALQARMDKLEQQLVMMQKILILKDEQIASLQNKKEVDQTESATEAKENVEPGKIKIKKLAEVLAEKKAAEENAKIAKEKLSQPAVTEVKPVVPAEKKTVEKTKPKVKLKPAPEVKEDSGFMSLAIAGGSVIILAILGLMWWRKKQEDEEIENESMFAAASEISLPDSGADNDNELSIPIAEDSSLYDVGTVGESSFLSEFTPSDFDAFDTDESEVDPISEADVYLAYGRYQQAEDLMVQAIKDFPERDECKLKLLEIYYTNENKSSFEKYSKELVVEGKPEDKKFWGKVIEMGKELDPESSLYIDHATFESVDLEQNKQADDTEQKAAEVDETHVEALDEGSSDIAQGNEEIDFDLSVFDDAVTSSNETVEEAEKDNTDENSLDFDLSVFDVDDNKEVEEQPAEELETVDFSSGSEALDDAEAEAEEIKIEQEDDSNIESFDFDFDDLGGEDNQADKDDAEPDVINLNEESDIDLDNFDFSLDENAEVKEEISLESEVKVEEDKGIDDFDFDFDEPTIPTSVPVTELDEGVSDLTDMDELETKLDLAKAYIDMGDAEAAKDIAEEILEKGTPEQKVSAQEVLDQLK